MLGVGKQFRLENILQPSWVASEPEQWKIEIVDWSQTDQIWLSICETISASRFFTQLEVSNIWNRGTTVTVDVQLLATLVECRWAKNRCIVNSFILAFCIRHLNQVLIFYQLGKLYIFFFPVASISSEFLELDSSKHKLFIFVFCGSCFRSLHIIHIE